VEKNFVPVENKNVPMEKNFVPVENKNVPMEKNFVPVDKNKNPLEMMANLLGAGWCVWLFPTG